MAVQTIDVDDVSSFLEGAFNVAIFPHSVPHSVSAGVFVENAVIGESLFGFDDRFERLVLDLNEFSGIIGEARRFGDRGGNRLSLVKDFAHGHGEVANFLRVVGTDFDERLGLRGNLLSGNRAYYPWQHFGRGSVNAYDPRVRIRRAHKPEIEHFAQLDVVGKLAPATQQPVLFLTRKRRAYPWSAAVLLFFFGHDTWRLRKHFADRSVRATRTIPGPTAVRLSISEFVSCLMARVGHRQPMPAVRKSGLLPANSLSFREQSQTSQNQQRS